MKLSKLLIIFLTTATTCLAGMIMQTSHSEDTTSIVDAVVNVVKSCYGNQVTTVGLAGDMPEILIKKLSSQKCLSITLIDHTTSTVRNSSGNRKSSYQLQIFVVKAYSATKLEEIINGIKESRWWNHMASFFIFDGLSMSKFGCSNAFNMLRTAWELDLLNAKFICLHQAKGLLIYNYNPYTSYAPVPWEHETTYSEIKGHPWTLFYRVYRQDRGNCDKLDFDKTTNLGGYEIRCTVFMVPPIWSRIPNKTGIESFGGISGVTAQIIFHALNATAKVLVHPIADIFQNTTDYDLEMVNGFSDIGLNFRHQSTVINLTLTNPYGYAELAVVTQYRGYVSQLRKIETIIDFDSQCCLYLGILIVLIFFKCFPDQTLPLAILNTVRFFSHGSLPKLPNNISSRIYLTGLFLFWIIMHSHLSGKFSSLLMKLVPLPDVNTIQDLSQLGYTVYGYKEYRDFFKDSVFNFVALENFDCINYVLESTTAACAEDRRFLISDATALKLHLSSKPIGRFVYVFVIRPNWPLEQRVNKVLSTLVESRIMWYINMREYQMNSSTLFLQEKVLKTDILKAASLHDLGFAFVILGIGLACGTITFIAELVIGGHSSSTTVAKAEPP